MKKNALYAQSGGVTAVINATAGALILEAKKSNKIGKVFAAKNGILGALREDLIDTSKESNNSLLSLRYRPGGIFGSCRFKLKDLETSEKEYRRLIEVFKAHNIGYFFYNGGNDSADTAFKVSQISKKLNYPIQCIAIPKTVDNDVYPISQTLGAWTAAEQGAIFFENIANENTTSHRQLIIHEVMGRHCGWLTAYTAKEYHERLNKKQFLSEILIEKNRWDIDAIYIPEIEIDFNAECSRLKKLMDEKDSINIFLSEGAGTDTIVSEMESNGETVTRDAFGHVALDTINPGQWFAKQFAKQLNADKTLVQKSGYFARSASPNKKDLDLIKLSGKLGAETALSGKSGVIGLDDDNNALLSLINFERIKGGKPFDPTVGWFNKLLTDIGQK